MLLAAVLTASLFSGPVAPFCPVAARSSAAPPATPATASGAAMRAAIDPATGRFVAPAPSSAPAFSPAVREMLSGSHEGLVEEHRPDGSVVVDLKGRMMSAAVATVGPDGVLSITCVSQVPSPDGNVEKRDAR